MWFNIQKHWDSCTKNIQNRISKVLILLPIKEVSKSTFGRNFGCCPARLLYFYIQRTTNYSDVLPLQVSWDCIKLSLAGMENEKSQGWARGESRELARGRPPWQAPGDDDGYHVFLDDDADDDADGGGELDKRYGIHLQSVVHGILYHHCQHILALPKNLHPHRSTHLIDHHNRASSVLDLSAIQPRATSQVFLPPLKRFSFFKQIKFCRGGGTCKIVFDSNI